MVEVILSATLIKRTRRRSGRQSAQHLVNGAERQVLDQRELVGATEGEPAYAGVRVPYDGDVNRCAMLPSIPARMNDCSLRVRFNIVGPVCFSHYVASPSRRPPL